MPRSRGGSPGPRLFVALDLPVAVRDALSGWLLGQRDVHTVVRAIPARNLHLTIAFLGTRDQSEIDAIAQATRVAATSVSALGLRTGAPVWLPPRRPRSLAVEIHDDRGDLSVLHPTVSYALRDAIGWHDDRPFRPHVTIGRRRPDAPLPRRGLVATPSLGFEGTALTLYRSILEPTGARYVPVERVELT